MVVCEAGDGGTQVRGWGWGGNSGDEPPINRPIIAPIKQSSHQSSNQLALLTLERDVERWAGSGEETPIVPRKVVSVSSSCAAPCVGPATRNSVRCEQWGQMDSILESTQVVCAARAVGSGCAAGWDAEGWDPADPLTTAPHADARQLNLLHLHLLSPLSVWVATPDTLFDPNRRW